MKFERLQLVIAILLSLSIHAGAAMLGNLQFGSARQSVALLAVNITTHSSLAVAQVVEKSPSKFTTEAIRKAAINPESLLSAGIVSSRLKTEIGINSVQNLTEKQSVKNIQYLTAGKLNKTEVRQHETKPEPPSLTAISVNKAELITEAATQTDKQVTVAKQTKGNLQSRIIEKIENEPVDVKKRPPVDDQLLKVVDKDASGMALVDSWDLRNVPPESAPELSEINKSTAEKQTFSKARQYSSLVLDEKTGETATTTSIPRIADIPKPGKTAIPLYHLIPKPVYPSRSRDLGETGTVILSILVGNDGSVADTYISKSSGFILLDASALETVKSKWRFKPATSHGEPVASWVRVPIKFSLR